MNFSLDKTRVKKTFPELKAWIRNIRHLFRRPKWFFLRKIAKNSIFISEFEIVEASLFPRKTIDSVMGMYKPKSVLDLGCGVGKSLDYFLSLGVDSYGVEGSALAITKAKNSDKILRYNLEKELNLKRKFDLVWSFEFVEHIHQRYIKNLLKSFSNHSDIVIVSAAPPGQGGDGHFNEQPAEYWIHEFSQYGYKFNKTNSLILRELKDSYSKNIIVFER